MINNTMDKRDYCFNEAYNQLKQSQDNVLLSLIKITAYKKWCDEFAKLTYQDVEILIDYVKDIILGFIGQIKE